MTEDAGGRIQRSDVAEAERFIAHFDLFDEDLQPDTYSVCRGMHSERGRVVHRDRRGSYWSITGCMESLQIVRDWRTFSPAPRSVEPSPRSSTG